MENFDFYKNFIALSAAGIGALIAGVWLMRRANNTRLHATNGKIVLQNSSFQIPSIVQASDLLAHDPMACRIFYENLRKHTFAVIKVQGPLKTALEELEEVGSRYFHLPLDLKARNKETTMGNNNIGYVNVEKVREYLKACPSFLLLII